MKLRPRPRPRKRFVRKFLRPRPRSIRSRVHKPFWDALMRSVASPTPGEVAMSALGTMFSNGAPPENYQAIERLCTNPDGSRFAPPRAVLRDALGILPKPGDLVTPPEKSWVKSTVVLEGAILTGGTAQRGWLAEDGVWPAREQAELRSK